MCLFWQDPPCVRGHFPCVTCWIRKLDLLTSRETPVSTHTSIWPFSHSEVQAGGNKPFFPLCGIQHEHSAHVRLLWSSGPVQQNLSMLLAIHSFNPAPHPPPPHLLEGRLLVDNRIQKGGWGQSRAAWLWLHQQLSRCQECKTFPKEIPPPPGRHGRKPREFWHISGSGSEHEKERSEGADWSTASKVCEQHGGAWRRVIFPKWILRRTYKEVLRFRSLQSWWTKYH